MMVGTVLAVCLTGTCLAAEPVYDEKSTRTVINRMKTVGATGFAAETVTLTGIPYYPEGVLKDQKAEDKCRLDLRYPKSVKGFKTVVWFHGGGLTHGARHWLPLADPTIAQVPVAYRFLGVEATRGDECIEDAAAAVAWTLRHIAEYGGDPKGVYVAGLSAGAYLTMMVGMDAKRLAKGDCSNMDLAGLVPISGQVTAHFAVRQFAGDTDPQFQPKIDDLSALRYVAKDLPPLLLICGQPPWEWQVRAEENRMLVASCKALGNKNARFVELPYANHGRAFVCGVPYLELFVHNGLPEDLK